MLLFGIACLLCVSITVVSKVFFVFFNFIMVGWCFSISASSGVVSFSFIISCLRCLPLNMRRNNMFLS